MADEGLSLRDIKRQERLEKRGGGLGRLPPSFWQQSSALRTQLQQALRECGPSDSSRYIDLHEDLKRLEGLLREITVNRERKLLLAAHEAVSGLRPDLTHMEKREQPLFEDLKRVLGNYRQQVFTGPEPPATTPGMTPEVTSTEMPPTADTPITEVDGPSPSLEPEPPVEPIDPPLSTSDVEPTEPAEPAPAIPAAAASGPAPDDTGSEAPADEVPPLMGTTQETDPDDSPQAPMEPVDDTATQMVRVVEDQPPFTGIDAQVYTLKAQDVLSLPVFNAQRLAEVGAVVPIQGLAPPSSANEGRPDGTGEQAAKGG